MARQQITDRQKKITYSTTEQLTGDVWIDGKPIYRKTVDCGALPNATNKNVAHGASVDRIVNTYGVGYRSSDNFMPVIPYTALTTNQSIQVFANNVNIVLTTGINRTDVLAWVTIEYTKT